MSQEEKDRFSRQVERGKTKKIKAIKKARGGGLASYHPLSATFSFFVFEKWKGKTG